MCVSHIVTQHLQIYPYECADGIEIDEIKNEIITTSNIDFLILLLKLRNKQFKKPTACKATKHLAQAVRRQGKAVPKQSRTSVATFRVSAATFVMQRVQIGAFQYDRMVPLSATSCY